MISKSAMSKSAMSKSVEELLDELQFDCFDKMIAPTSTGGARRDRTDDLLLAKQALSQLSYGPLRDQ